MRTPSAPVVVDEGCLRAWPLPKPDGDGDKEERGRSLIVGGSREVPGAVMLAGTAALRAGAGKLTIATVASAAGGIAMALPEARVLALPETVDGEIAIAAAEQLREAAGKADAVLIGPGARDENACAELTASLLPSVRNALAILDASAMFAVQLAAPFDQSVLLTPHAGEMARLLQIDKKEVQADSRRCAAEAASRWKALVALKGSRTVIANAKGELWQHDAEVPGLACSGSGDVLAGLILGLAARGAGLEQAACWGAALHARAGQRLAQRMGTLGYLARELAAEVPALMQALAGS